MELLEIADTKLVGATSPTHIRTEAEFGFCVCALPPSLFRKGVVKPLRAAISAIIDMLHLPEPYARVIFTVLQAHRDGTTKGQRW